MLLFQKVCVLRLSDIIRTLVIQEDIRTAKRRVYRETGHITVDVFSTEQAINGICCFTVRAEDILSTANTRYGVSSFTVDSVEVFTTADTRNGISDELSVLIIEVSTAKGALNASYSFHYHHHLSVSA